MEGGSSSSVGRGGFGVRSKRATCVRDFPPGCGRQPRPGAVRRAAGTQPEDVRTTRPSTRHPSLVNPQGNQSRRTINPAERMRTKVKETLKYFRDTCKELQKGKSSLSSQGTTNNHLLFGESSTRNKTLRRVDLKASRMMKEEGRYINTVKRIGPVPGVEIGDRFHYRVELNIVGLHHRLENGIDYLKDANGRVLATSIVSSGEYDQIDRNSGCLVYMGEGGHASGRVKNSEVVYRDQRLERGNLALKNSIEARNSVRVIRRMGNYQGNRFEDGASYQYDGLYVVRRFWQKREDHGKLVFMYELARISDEL